MTISLPQVTQAVFLHSEAIFDLKLVAVEDDIEYGSVRAKFPRLVLIKC